MDRARSVSRSMIFTWFVCSSAAAGDDDTPDRLVQFTHFAHEHAYILPCSDEKDFVAFANDRPAVRDQRLAAAVNGGDSPFRVRDVFRECGNFLIDQQATAVDACTDQSHTPIGEVEHLQRARVQDQLLDVFTDKLLRADADVDGNGILREQLFRGHVIGAANACDFRRRLEQCVADLAGDHIGLVGVRERDDNVRVAGTGAFEHFRVSRVTNYGPDVEAILEFPEDFGARVDDGDFVRLFTREMVGRGGADLASAENQYFHSF